MICVNFFGGCQLATIGILSEYLGSHSGPGERKAAFHPAGGPRLRPFEPRRKSGDPCPAFRRGNRESKDARLRGAGTHEVDSVEQ